MAKCPVCEVRAIDHWWRGFIVAICLGLLIGFVAGQLFHSWQFGKVFGGRIEILEERNEELRKGFIPPRGK